MSFLCGGLNKYTYIYIYNRKYTYIYNRKLINIMYDIILTKIDTSLFLFWTARHESRFLHSSFKNCLVSSAFPLSDTSGAKQLT